MLKDQVRQFYDDYHQRRVRRPSEWIKSTYWCLFTGRVLEVGAGTLVPDAETYPDYTAVDLSVQAIMRIQQPCVIADAESLPFRDGAFDTVACHDVLEHIYNPQRMLIEMCRVSSERVVVAGPNYVGEEVGNIDRKLPARLVRWIFDARRGWRRLFPHLSFDEHWQPDADAITAANSAWVAQIVQRNGYRLTVIETWPTDFRSLNYLPMMRHLGPFMLVIGEKRGTCS